ncbi:MAG: porin family protein [Myxococcota bacterium]|nr:porin family protein [Myxococcota bacterium]
MMVFKGGLCAALATVGVLALPGTVAAQQAPNDDLDRSDTSQSQGTQSQGTQGSPPAQTPAGDPDFVDPNDDHIPGNAAHDPSRDAANLPDPNVPPPTNATTWSAGNTGVTDPAVSDPNYGRPRRGALFDDLGFAIAAGGGVAGFTDETARSITNDGGGWNVRATIGTRIPLAAEVAYIGSVQTIEALGLDDNALLVGNGLQANARLNILRTAAVQPFVFAGVAWRRYDLTRTNTNTSDISDLDNVLEIPVGAGLGFRFSGLLVDLRGEYRAASNEDLMPSLAADIGGNQQAALHRWGANASLGYEF